MFRPEKQIMQSKHAKVTIVVVLVIAIALTILMLVNSLLKVENSIKGALEEELSGQFKKPIHVEIFAELDYSEFKIIGFQFSGEATSNIGYCVLNKSERSSDEFITIKISDKMIKRGTDIFVDHLRLTRENDSSYLIVLSLNRELDKIEIRSNEGKTELAVDRNPISMSVVSIPRSVSEFEYEFFDLSGDPMR